MQTNYSQCVAKKQLFCKFWLWDGSCDLLMCCFVGWGFFFLQGGEEKNKINSIKFAPNYLQRAYQNILISLFKDSKFKS